MNDELKLFEGPGNIIRLTIDGEEVPLDSPIRVEEGDVITFNADTNTLSVEPDVLNAEVIE